MNIAGKYAGYSNWVQKNWLARELNKAASAPFGWEYNKRGISRGFMGMKGWKAESRMARQQGAKGYGKMAGRMGFRAAGGIFSAYSVVSGFEEGGIAGGLEGIMQSSAMNIGIQLAVGGGLNPLGLATLAATATVYGGYKFLEASQKNLKDLKKMEIVDNGLLGASRSQGAYTMRQRSLNALQNTHINGRMHMGNEALMHHTSYR